MSGSNNLRRKYYLNTYIFPSLIGHSSIQMRETALKMSFEPSNEAGQRLGLRVIQEELWKTNP